MAERTFNTVSTDWQAQQREIDRQRKLAEMLTEQGQQSAQGGMVGNIYVAPSWTQGAAQLARALAGRKVSERVAEQERDLSTRRSQALADALRGMPTPRTEGTTGEGMTGGLDMQDYPRGAAPGDTRTVQPTMQDNAAWLGQLAALGPDAVGIGNAMIGIQARQAETAEQRKFREQESAAARQARIDAQNATIAAQREQQAREQAFRDQQARQAAMDRENLARVTGQIAASNRPERMMTVMGPDGEPISMPQSQAAGMTPYSPAAAKALKESKSKEGARTQLNETVTQLKGYYDSLKEGGGIVSQAQGPLSNLASRAQSSGIGQTLGGAVGTKNQEARQKIEQTRPLLMNLIKNATGMSAQQMNSTAEMQLYLRAATDPTLSYEANMEALDNLDRLFGLGLGVSGNPRRRATDNQSPAAGSAGQWSIVR